MKSIKTDKCDNCLEHQFDGDGEFRYCAGCDRWLCDYCYDEDFQFRPKCWDARPHNDIARLYKRPQEEAA